MKPKHLKSDLIAGRGHSAVEDVRDTSPREDHIRAAESNEK